MTSSKRKSGFLLMFVIIFFLLAVMFYWAGNIGYVNQGETYSSIFDWLLQPSPGFTRNYVFIWVIGGVFGLLFVVFLILFIVNKKKNK